MDIKEFVKLKLKVSKPFNYVTVREDDCYKILDEFDRLNRYLEDFKKYLSDFKLDVCQGDCMDEIYGKCKEFDKCKQYNKF